MPAGLGGFDDQGIWQFGEDDTEVLMSDLLNNGMQSVSDQLLFDRARLTDLEEAPVPVAMAAGLITASSGVWSERSFPVGRFTQPPIITGSIISGASDAIGATILITNITTTKFLLRMTADASASWVAVQMTPGSSAG